MCLQRSYLTYLNIGWHIPNQRPPWTIFWAYSTSFLCSSRWSVTVSLSGFLRGKFCRSSTIHLNYDTNCSAKSLRTPSNIFVVNLAFCDFVMMLKTPIFIYNSFTRGFTLGNVGCQIFGVMGTLSGIGASTTNVSILSHCIDAKNVIWNDWL